MKYSLECFVNLVEICSNNISSIGKSNFEGGSQPLDPLSCQPPAPVLLEVNDDSRDPFGPRFFLEKSALDKLV